MPFITHSSPGLMTAIILDKAIRFLPLQPFLFLGLTAAACQQAYIAKQSLQQLMLCLANLVKAVDFLIFFST